MADRRKPMSQINLVPLIDVMLVLLVISMVTVPLLTQGIDIDLPQKPSKPLEDAEDDPFVVTIRKDGRIYVNVGVTDIYDEDSNISMEDLQTRAEIILGARPDVPIFIRADKNLMYGAVVDVMNLLQQAGAPNVGLITDPPNL